MLLVRDLHRLSREVHAARTKAILFLPFALADDAEHRLMWRGHLQLAAWPHHCETKAIRVHVEVHHGLKYAH